MPSGMHTARIEEFSSPSHIQCDRENDMCDKAVDVGSNAELRKVMGVQLLRQAALVGEGKLWLPRVPSFLCRMQNHSQ